MDIGIVLLIVFSNLACFALGVWAFRQGISISFFNAKDYQIPPKKNNPKKNNNGTSEEDSSNISEKYRNL